MAKLLIMAKDNTHTDPWHDARDCWKKYDIVAALPDNHVFGSKEGLPNFYHVETPLSIQALTPYCGQPEIDGEVRLKRSLYTYDPRKRRIVNKNDSMDFLQVV